MYRNWERTCTFNEFLEQHKAKTNKQKVTKQNPNKLLNFLQTKWAIEAFMLIAEANRGASEMPQLFGLSNVQCIHSVHWQGSKTPSITNSKSDEFSACNHTGKLASCTSETAPGLLISSHSDIKNVPHISCYACTSDTKRSFLHRLLLTPTLVVILTWLLYEDFCPDSHNYWENHNFGGWDHLSCVHSSKFSRNAFKE